MSQPQEGTYSGVAVKRSTIVAMAILAVLMTAEYIIFRMSGHLTAYLWFLFPGCILGMFLGLCEDMLCRDSSEPLITAFFTIAVITLSGPPIVVLFPWFIGGPWPF